MPTFYNYTQDGLVYSFDDVFVPADAFSEGNLWTWGYGASGQLGDNTTTSKSTPVTTFAGGTNWKQVSFGYKQSAAIKTDGTLWTWGSNTYGQLGDNSFIGTIVTPVTTFAGGTNWKQVSVGAKCCVAIKTDGTLWTWGSNSNGQLGNNRIFDSATPITTFAGGTNWKQVFAGGLHCAAIKTDGTLWTWGDTSFGQLGNNRNVINAITPVTTFAGGTNWKQVSAGSFHTAAIKTDGTLWTWGRGDFGRLGDNTSGFNDKSTPVTTFAGGTNWKQVSCGIEHTAAIKTDGTLWTWGAGSYGQLGDNNTTTSKSTPITTFAGGTNWKQVSFGGRYCSAIKTDGTLWTWGRNNSRGQLGDGTKTNRLTPVTTFLGGTNWKQVSAGDEHCAALTFIDPTFPS